MESPPRGEITLLLTEWKNGKPEAFERLMPLAYSELKEIAGSYLRRERPDQTLQATALVHELYLRLIQQKKVQWNDRRHFFTFAAKLMRMILIDHARAHQAQKRGGELARVPLNENLRWISIHGPEMLDLDRALEELRGLDPRKVDLVELCFFLGCTSEEAAGLLDLSKATVDRDLKFVKAWLYQRLRGAAAQPSAPDER